MNHTIAPGVRSEPASPPVLTKCRVKWPMGEVVTAEMQSHYSNENANVRWTGAVEKLKEPPQNTDACALAAYLEYQAQLTGGIFDGRQDGLWPAMDEVKS